MTTEPVSKSSRREQLRRLDRLGAPAKPALRGMGLCAVASGLLLIPQSALIATLVQRCLVDQRAPALSAWLFVAVAVVALLRALLGWCGQRLGDSAIETIQVRMRAGLIRRLFARGVPWLRRQSSGALSELPGTHVDSMRPYFTGYLSARMELVAVPLAMLGAVFSVDVVVGVILLLAMPLIPVFMALTGWGAEAASRGQLKSLTRMSGHFADRLRGLGLIRVYGRGAAELAGVANAAEGVRAGSMKVLRIAFLSSAVLEFFASISVALVAVYLGLTHLGMLALRSAPLTLGGSLFCLLLAPEYFAPMRRLAAHYHDRAAALAALDEIEQVLPENRESANGSGAASERSAGSPDRPVAVIARDLHVRHAGATQDVIAGLDFELKPGERVALAGPSGGGKSTLLETLAGWLKPSGGTLEITPAGSRVGYAPQRPFLFHGTIAENLLLARPDASRAELEQAAEAAQVMRFVRRLPAALETVIGERGFGLSGGEARRIALARLYLWSPDLLLLDEPTAFLDPQTEADLLRELAVFARGRTLLIATHSRAAMHVADRVFSLQPADAKRKVAS